jgi:excinuclease UvrABC ATPase subunit
MKNPNSLTGKYLSGEKKITSKEMKLEKNKGEIILKKSLRV